MAPAGIVDGPLMGCHELRAVNEVLTRLGLPSASQDLIRLPELGAGGVGGRVFSRLAAPEADHRVRSAALRGTPLVTSDSRGPTCLVGQPVVRPWFRRSPP